jgi:hypothetical protein
MVETNIWIGLIFGIVGTVVLHISKAMERQGIEIFDQIRAKLKNTESGIEGGAKKPTIYMIGFILNQTIIIWMMIGTMYAPPSYYTSVFGLGLIALMIYSALVLKEEIQRIEYIGSIVLVFGTLILGYDGIRQEGLVMADINVNLVMIIAASYFILGMGIVLITKKYGTPQVVGVVFGIFAGGCGGIDPVLKAVGQTQGQTSFLPSTPIGWFLFVASFLFATTSFLVTQWGFARKAKASVLVPCYNTLYLINPILIQAVTLPNFMISGLTFVGIAVTATGIFLMQVFRKQMPTSTHSIEIDTNAIPSNTSDEI